MSELFYWSELHEVPGVLDLYRPRDTDVHQRSFPGFLDVGRVVLEKRFELKILKSDFGFLPFVPVKVGFGSEFGQCLRILVVAAGLDKSQSGEYVLGRGLLDDDFVGVHADWEVFVYFWDQVVEQLTHLADLFFLLFFGDWLHLLGLGFGFLFLDFIESQNGVDLRLGQLIVVPQRLNA